MESTFWLCAVIALLLSCSTTNGKEEERNLLVMEKVILDDILNSTKYDQRVRPMKTGDELSPTEVTVNMYILTISRVDDSRMQYNLQMFLRQKWTDERLSFDDLGGDLPNINLFDDKVWSPDIFIVNEKSGYVNSLMKPNRFIRIYPDGGVLSSARVSFVLSCPMTFHWFPFDNQLCIIHLESFGFTAKDVVLKWDKDSPVLMADSVTFAYYNIQKMETVTNPVALTTGNYSTLRLGIHLKRSISYHVIHSFIPCTMLVIISWITFWLDHKAITTRLFPVLSSLVVLVFKVSDINANLPIVSYVKSIDIWTGTCLCFVFAALIEVVIVDYRWRSVTKKQRRAAGVLDTADEENGAAFDMKPLVESDDGSAFLTRSHSNDAGRLRNLYYRWIPKLPTGPKKLDVISRYLFPVCFISFFIFYWTVNLMYYAIA